ncbi:MAG TPA: fibronectin type III domain-containing protein [Kofleriaceae bacterium]|nr:fibronectin type III domain-containing protein [Kofleriaceae bacterium]
MTAVAANARAGNDCRIVDVSYQLAAPQDPADRYRPQVVAWIEDTAGNFVATVYITAATGTYGLGNRPGRFDFNSSPMWPYGRRVTVFPVWSHKQPLRWPEVVFQDGNDDNLSHSGGQSSPDLHYCRPLQPDEFDALTCPSAQAYTDKGVFSASAESRYPPRNDLAITSEESPDAAMYDVMNPFDTISQATPAFGVGARGSFVVPPEVVPGDYVLFVEVAREFDMNATYNETRFPSPTGIPWLDYGLPYRGQPSVVYRVPFTLGATDVVATTDQYIGYGDPDGLDGNIRAPDATISNEPGTGAGRLALIADGTSTYRVKVGTRREIDEIAPVAPRVLAVTEIGGTSVTFQFRAPGDDGRNGTPQSYEIRYRAGEPITDANFADSTLANVALPVLPSGELQTVTLSGLLPDTAYSIGVRAYDNCHNPSPLAVVEATTPERLPGEVDACFVATAAYGSVLANEVGFLRHFRDALLRKTVLGELAVETYYTFGPAFAGVIGESDLLRATARDVLGPIVVWLRARSG